MAENFANAAQTTLNGALDSSQTNVVVTSAGGFPSVNFRIVVDSELMLVTNVSGSTFTVTRHIESSSAATHSDGATVTHVLTAAGLLQGIRENGVTLEGSLVQQASSAVNQTSPKDITLGAAPTVGNFLYCITLGATNVAITPSETNVSWSSILNITNGTTSGATLWKGTISASASATITLTRASGSAFFAGWAVEFSGIDGTLDSSSTSTGTGFGFATPAINPPAAVILLTGAVGGNGGTGNWVSPLFSTGLNANFLFAGYRMGHLPNFPIGGGGLGPSTTVSLWSAFTAAIT